MRPRKFFRSSALVPAAIIVFCSIFASLLLTQSTLQPPASGTWAASGSMAQARAGASAALLADGRVLVTGGSDATGPSASAEFLSNSGSFSSAPPMTTARRSHLSVTLKDGRVLVAGGTSSGGATYTAEIYDPALNSWATIASGMTEARSGASATLLQDGRVLIAGGSAGAVSPTVEVFDPASNTFSFAGSLSMPRTGHAAAPLQDGRVLIVGGFNGSAPVASSDIFDPSTNSVSAGPALAAARQGHSATTLLDGSVLVAGGNNGSADLASAELFSPATGNFSAAGSLSTARSGHLAFLLPNNNGVLITGGTFNGASVASSELYRTPYGTSTTPSGTFTPSGAMTTLRSQAAGTPLLMPGALLVAGGTSDGSTSLASSEVYGFPTVKTDRSDYPPGTAVNITGSGFKAGETVALQLLESPLFDTHGPYTVTADANGNISDSSFVTDEHDLNIRFYLTATGAISGSVAQNTFTDSTALVSITVGAQTPNPVGAGNSVGYTVTATFSGSCTVSLMMTGTALPAGAQPPTSASVSATSSGSSQFNWPITTTTATPAGTTNGLTITATGTGGPGSNCTSTNTNVTSNSFSLVVSQQKLVFTSSPFSIPFTACSPAITVQRQNSSGAPLTSGTLDVTFSSASPAGQFYSDNACTTLLPSSTITIANGQSTNAANTVFYKGNGGAPTLTASNPSFVSAKQVVTVIETVTIGNGPASPDGTYLNATNIAQTGAFGNVTVNASTIVIGDDIDLSGSVAFGPTFFTLALNAPTVNFAHNVKIGSGSLSVNATTANLNGALSGCTTAVYPCPTFAPLSASRLLGTATTVNVQSASASLQDAVNLSSKTTPGTIDVASGQYTGNLTIDRSLTLLGDPGSTTVAGPGPSAPQVTGATAGGTVIAVNAPNVSINGLALSDATGGTASVEAIHGSGVANVTIRDNSFTGFTQYGVDFSSSNNLDVEYNVFSGFGIDAIHVIGGTGVTVANNVIDSPATPFLSDVRPVAAVPGGPSFTLTVRGTGFINGKSAIHWNGTALTTACTAAAAPALATCTATVPAADIAAAGTASITVVNSVASPSDGTSNVVFLPITNATASVAFNSVATAVGSGPVGSAVGDFNADGKQDLAITNTGSNTLSILLGNGDGTFTLKSSPGTGAYPFSVAVGDYNGDGKLDLAVANSVSNTVSILLGNGDGTFTLKSSPTTGVNPNFVAAVDLNGDGKLDLAVANSLSATLTILLGNGDGTFTAAVSPTTPTEPSEIAVGDFNGDGNPDLAVANNNNIGLTILLGNGDGTFTAAASPSTGGLGLGYVVAGDLNGDGKLDLAVALPNVNAVMIFLGNGDGTFTAGSSSGAGTLPFSIAMGDFNGDGNLDLAVGDQNASSTTILLGNGDGTFTANAQSPSTGLGPFVMAVGDFNRDGRLDTVSANYSSNSISVLMQSADLTATKTNDVSGSTTPPNGWHWTISVANTGSVPATFSSGQIILTDNLPNSNIASYGTPAVVNPIGVTGTIACTISSSNLNCTASGGPVVLAYGASFGVKFLATPTNAEATFVNPRSGGVCSVDPGHVVAEATEGNNTCSDTVLVNNGETMTANPGTTPQATAPSTAFPNALALTVLDAAHNPKPNESVTFTAPSSGASGLFSNSTNTITLATNASGIASVPFTANATVGSYNVTASASGLPPVVFALANKSCATTIPMFFQGASQTLNTTLVNPYNGETINVNGTYNVNTACYSGTGNDLLMTNSSDALFAAAPFGNQIPSVTNIGRIITGNGNDIIDLASSTIALGNLAIFGSGGNTILWGNSGNDTINAGTGNDQVNGGPGNDTVSGGAGDDRLDGGAGNDTVHGDAGNDTLVYYLTENIGATDVYDGGLGTDTLELHLTTAQANTLAAELASAQTFINTNTNPSSNTGAGPTFTFTFGLTFSNIEALTIIITDPPVSITANAGTTPQSAATNSAFANALALTVLAAGNTPVAGASVVFTAPASGASGTFSNSTNTITVVTNASGVASAPFTANSTAGGPYTVTAALGALSAGFSLTNTGPASTTTSVTSSSTLNTSTYGQSVTFTAMVTSGSGTPTGSVTFYDGGTCAAPGSTFAGPTSLVSGQAAFTTSALTPPSHTIVACYTPTGNFSASSGTVTQTVNKAPQTINITQDAPASAGYNTSFTVIATGGASGNSITFAIVGGSVCSITGSTSTSATVKMTSGSGTCQLTLDQAGDTNYNAATQKTTAQTAAQRAGQTITFTQPASPAAYNSTFGVAPTSDSGLTISVQASGGCSIAAGTVTMTSGTTDCTLKASQAGDGNYNAASDVTRIVSAAKANQATLTVTGPSSVTYGTTGMATASGGSGTGVLSFSVGASNGCSLSGTTVSVTNAAGTCSLTAMQAGDTNYNPAASVAFTVTLNKAALMITPDGGKSKMFGATFTAFTGMVTGLVSPDAVTVTYTSTGAAASAAVGTYDIAVGTVAFTTGNTSNYNVTKNTAVNGLTVIPAPASQLVFLTAPQTLTAGQCSSVITVTSEDFGGNVSNVSGATVVSLSTGSPGGAFFSDNACSQSVPSMTIASGANSTSFYYKDSKAGTPTITANSLTSPTQQETVNPAVASKLAISTVPFTILAGQCSGTVTVTSQDQFGNTSSVAGNTQVDLTSASAGGKFYSDSSCQQQVMPVSGKTFVNIPNGSNSASFFYADTVPGTIASPTTSITVADDASTLTSGTQAGTILHLAFTTASFAVGQNQCSGQVTLTAENASNVATPLGLAAILNLTSSSGGATFYSANNCSAPVSSVTIALSASAVSFSYQDSTAGNPTLTAAIGAYSLTQLETVGTPPSITSANSTVFTVTAAGSFTVTTTGSPTISLSKTGSLPSGVTFIDNGNGTATLSGTPALGTVNGYPITIKATNGISPDATQNFTLTIQSATPSITFGTAPAPTFLSGNFAVSATTNSDGALTYSVMSGPCTFVSGSTFSSSGAGTCVVKASTAATTNFTAGSNTQNVIIAKADQTTVTVATPGAVTYGVPSSATASGGSGTGSYSFNAGLSTGCLVTGSSSVSVTNVAGSCAITAIRAGDLNFNPSSPSAPFSIVLNRATLSVTADNKAMYQGTSVPSLTGTLTGVVTGDGITVTYSTTGTATSAVNTYPITATLHDPNTKLGNYNVTNTPGTLTINPRPTSIVYAGAFSGSYASCSSNVVSARLTDTLTGLGINGAAVIITVGTQSVTLATDATGLASTSLGITQNPGTVSANASFAGDATHSGSATSNLNNYTINPSSGVGPLTGNPVYTGFTFFWTTSPSSSTATLTLSATVQDTSTPCHGDIRSARVTFAVRHSDGTYAALSGAQNLPVGLVNPADSTVGTASATTQYNLGNSNADSIEIAVIVGGNYARNQSADDTIVEVAKPGLANSMIGVGKLDNTASPLSSGYLANAPVPGGNYYTSVASNIQYNKSLTNPQGKVNILVKSYNKADGTIDTNVHTYSIVSNSISGLTEAQDPRTGMMMVSFSAKANVTEVTNPLSPVSVDSGVTMQVIFSPSGTSTPQTGSISVPKKAGGLWFTSAWDGTRTVQKTLAVGIVAVQ